MNVWLCELNSHVFFYWILLVSSLAYPFFYYWIHLVLDLFADFWFLNKMDFLLLACYCTLCKLAMPVCSVFSTKRCKGSPLIFEENGPILG